MHAPVIRQPTGATAPDLMLSFRHRDALAEAMTRIGRTVVAARRSHGIAARFAALGAHVLVIDARDAAVDALTAVEAAASAVASRGAGLIVILGDAEADMAPAFVAAGADQIIGAPWRDWELAAALLRADAGRIAAYGPTTAIIGGWQADLLTGQLQLDAGSDAAFLDCFAGLDQLRGALRGVDSAGRRAGFAAVQRLRDGAIHAAAVQTRGDERWVHHLSCRAATLSARVERLDMQAAAPPRDPQTGALTLTAAHAAIVAHQQGGDAVAVGFVEIARLALVNDAGGRDAGDQMLARVARLLTRQLSEDLGSTTLIARAGGARFLVIAPTGIGAARLSLELRAAAAVIMDSGMPVISGLPVALRVATGTLTLSDDLSTLAAIASRLATPRALVRSVDIEALLASDQLRVLFQPQFNMADDKLIGAEALVRWHHPKLGEVAGGVLFTAAQANGLERQLSNAVWQRALASMAAWPAELSSVRVALNATAADLADPHMPGALLAMAADAGVAPTRLTLEVTEADVIDVLDNAVAALRRLRAAGLRVALDDFGTGYSGLSWLKRLPADYIKIDASFARDAVGAPRDRAVLTGVISLAKALDLTVLAEGVETEEQRALLAAAGCSAWQGHLRAPALPDADFIALAMVSPH
jgi:EAL domain-containing protein (putative c-di-GMP-specific phosphodiesterase class I)